MNTIGNIGRIIRPETVTMSVKVVHIGLKARRRSINNSGEYALDGNRYC
ncbi:hypothetical protein AGMMS50222_11020 [Endomicrobiia bacterium]|nr:hypothetical protein AGMMS50222_11020 [Endomicrobiia bacterium]